MCAEIIIVGYPKSGNTWLSRLLSEALDWPVRGINEARPLAECGADRDDGHVIRQLHLYPRALGMDQPAIPDQHTFNTDAYHGRHKIVHILRDPRDVAVSIDYYWGIRDLQRVITSVMANGDHPLFGCGWAQYVNAWRRAPVPVIETRYEWLHKHPYAELMRLLNMLELRNVKPLSKVVTDQALEAKRADLLKNGEHAVHGLGAQLANLRAGRVGDWRLEFEAEHVTAFAERYTRQLLDLGYERNHDWLN